VAVVPPERDHRTSPGIMNTITDSHLPTAYFNFSPAEYQGAAHRGGVKDKYSLPVRIITLELLMLPAGN